MKTYIKNNEKYSLRPCQCNNGDTAIYKLKEKFINKYGGLIKALEKVVEVGDQYNFYNDLHSGNFMQREDGTIVIIDPWAFS